MRSTTYSDEHTERSQNSRRIFDSRYRHRLRHFEKWLTSPAFKDVKAPRLLYHIYNRISRSRHNARLATFPHFCIVVPSRIRTFPAPRYHIAIVCSFSCLEGYPEGATRGCHREFRAVELTRQRALNPAAKPRTNPPSRSSGAHQQSRLLHTCNQLQPGPLIRAQLSCKTSAPLAP